MNEEQAEAEHQLQEELKDAGKTRPRTAYPGADYYRDKNRPGK